ncbi:hypothetical protein [Candidatus Entotheonella palauensis]|uniref:hypothetical protein n=1 Tax=Candidatus Entotheonella palauensis TaxID=93172 RepID=UPI000B7FFDB4|nr:hypothetical protein [Candidatus Entotheonella palauensis]
MRNHRAAKGILTTQMGRGVLALLALIVFASFYSPAPALAADEVKIAIIVPLSGRWARQGELYKAGSEMAVDEINEQGVDLIT